MVAESGARLLSALFSAKRAFLSAIRSSRLSGTALASGIRRNLAAAVVAVSSAAAVTRVGVMVQVGSTVDAFEGTVQEAVLTTVTTEIVWTTPVLRTVVPVLVTVAVTLLGVIVMMVDEGCVLLEHCIITQT